jgi:hypothetical protein
MVLQGQTISVKVAFKMSVQQGSKEFPPGNENG